MFVQFDVQFAGALLLVIIVKNKTLSFDFSCLNPERRTRWSIFKWRAETTSTCLDLTSSPVSRISSTTSPTSLCWGVTQVLDPLFPIKPCFNSFHTYIQVLFNDIIWSWHFKDDLDCSFYFLLSFSAANTYMIKKDKHGCKGPHLIGLQLNQEVLKV